MPQTSPDFLLEYEALNSSPDSIVLGIDEAGRGPWAGPVTAAAAWINPCALDRLPHGLNDSKKISPQNRHQLFVALSALPQEVFRCEVFSCSAKDIDADGILPATFRAMDEAASALIINPNQKVIMLVDGNLPPTFDKFSRQIGATPKIIPVVRGDSKSLSIATASIMAKETRDRLMKSLDQAHPGYGWANNMGYGTEGHRAGLAKQGPTCHHRLSYKPVAQIADDFGYTR